MKRNSDYEANFKHALNDQVTFWFKREAHTGTVVAQSRFINISNEVVIGYDIILNDGSTIYKVKESDVFPAHVTTEQVYAIMKYRKASRRYRKLIDEIESLQKELNECFSKIPDNVEI